MPQDPRARALLINVGAYVVAVAIMAVVNLWQSPDYLWFLWVAAGWGIGVAAHALGYWLRHRHHPEGAFADPKVRRFTIHLFAYVAVIVLLFIVNMTATPNTWWFYWVALGWGIGLAANAWIVFGRQAPARVREDRQTPVKRSTPPPKKRAAPKKAAAKKAPSRRKPAAD